MVTGAAWPAAKSVVPSVLASSLAVERAGVDDGARWHAALEQQAVQQRRQQSLRLRHPTHPGAGYAIPCARGHVRGQARPSLQKSGAERRRRGDYPTVALHTR